MLNIMKVGLTRQASGLAHRTHIGFASSYLPASSSSWSTSSSMWTSLSGMFSLENHPACFVHKDQKIILIEEANTCILFGGWLGHTERVGRG